jgi:hypothetical protein
MPGQEAHISDNTRVQAPKLEQRADLASSAWEETCQISKIYEHARNAQRSEHLPPDPFGDIDSQALAFKSSEKKAVNPSDSPIPTKVDQMLEVHAGKVVQVEELLSKDNHRWQVEAKPEGPKCNAFLDGVMHDSGMPRPWAKTGVPVCREMQAQLEKDPRYEQSWSTDYQNYYNSYGAWIKFQLKAGDICLWNTDLTHGAIADGKGGLYYAGARASHSRNGCYHAPVTYVTGTVEAATNYGPPTKVFRYKGLVSR